MYRIYAGHLYDPALTLTLCAQTKDLHTVRDKWGWVTDPEADTILSFCCIVSALKAIEDTQGLLPHNVCPDDEIDTHYFSPFIVQDTTGGTE